jgi:cytosine/adenosine deaminase-related metal-dependent hydrolase
VSEPERVDLLLRHGRILTLDPERRILVDGAIAIASGRIVAIGPDREVGEAHAPAAARSRDLGGALVHPGLVDGHNHTNSRAARGLIPKDSTDWSPVEIETLTGMTPELEYASAVLSSMEMVASGTTIYADTGGSMFLDDTVRAIETVGMRGLPGWFVVDAPDAFQALRVSTEEGLRRLEDQLDRYPFAASAAAGRRVRSAVLLSGMLTDTDELVVAAKLLADDRGVPLIMHKSWDEAEVTASIDAHGRRPVERLADLGVLGPNVTLAHAIHLDDAEVALCAASGTSLVHCPNASMIRGVGAIRTGRFPEALAAGLTVALGSDGGRSGKHDVARSMGIVALANRELRGEFPVLTNEQALEMATLHGARALGMADEIGSLEVGKRADLVVHDLTRTEHYPRFHDLVDALVLVMQSGTVESVYVDGEAIYEGRRFTRFDAAAALAEVDRLAAGFEQRIGIGRFSAWPLVN